MQDEIAAILKIPLFIQLNLAGDLPHLDVFSPLFHPKKATPDAVIQIGKLLRAHALPCQIETHLLLNRGRMTHKQSQSLSPFC